MFRVSDRKKKMRRTAVAMVVLLSGVLLAAGAGHTGFWNLFSAAEDTASQLSVVHQVVSDTGSLESGDTLRIELLTLEDGQEIRISRDREVPLSPAALYLNSRLELLSINSLRQLELELDRLSDRVRRQRDQALLGPWSPSSRWVQRHLCMVRQGFLSEHRKLSNNVRQLDAELGLRLGQSASLLLIDPLQGSSLTGLKERLPVFTRLQTLEEDLDELRTTILDFGDPVLDSASCR